MHYMHNKWGALKSCLLIVTVLVLSGCGGGGGSSTPASPAPGLAPGPSSLSFSSATYSVAANLTSIVIEVNRTGDTSAAASVSYRVENGTATDGQDFTAANGTLQWAAGDATEQTFTVQVTTNTRVAGGETVALALQNPSPNSILGTIATATLTLLEGVPVVCNEVLDSNITVDTTLDEPCYQVTASIQVRDGAALTVQPGVRLEFDAGTQLNIAVDGSLNAVGTAALPILFTGSESTPGFWRGIQFTFSNSNSNVLEHVTVEDGGGGGGNGNANVVMFGRAGLIQRLRMSNVTLRNSAGYGFEFDTGSIVDEFSNVVSTGNAAGPGRVPASLVGVLDPDSQYTGNTVDLLRITGVNINEATSWPRLDVDYEVGAGNSIAVNAPLTIDAGVTMFFNANVGFRVNDGGSLTAIGTAAEPVTFTAVDPTPGFWRGIVFLSNSASNILDGVIVDYAGNSANGDGAVVVFFNDSSATVRNSTLRNSSTYGVWVAAGATYTSSNNTFSNNVSGEELLN